MGGMKSGTGDVWGDDEDEQEESVEDEEREVQTESVEQSERERTASTSDAGFPSGSEASSSEDSRHGSGASERSTPEVGGESERDDESASTSADVGDSSDDVDESGKPYVVRRMLKDKSVQFERDERLTLFVHDDVKTGEQELEAHAQELFGRDIPVFDIREAVYRAALRNRDDVVDELEEMGYTRE